MARLPSLYITHGGGPCFWMEFGPPFGPRAFEKLARSDSTEAVIRVFESLGSNTRTAMADLNRLGLDGPRTIRSITAMIEPALGLTMPMMHFMIVDLPLPLVPRSTTVSPAPMPSDTPSITRTAPYAA